MPRGKTVDEALSHLNAEQKANLGDLMKANQEGPEALRAAIKALNPKMRDPRDEPQK